jgi:hypothetical protein
MSVRPWACTTRGWAACRRHRLLLGPKVVQGVLRESGDAVGAGGELARKAVGRGASGELGEPSAGGGVAIEMMPFMSSTATVWTSGECFGVSNQSVVRSGPCIPAADRPRPDSFHRDVLLVEQDVNGGRIMAPKSGSKRVSRRCGLADSVCKASEDGKYCHQKKTS